MNALGWLLTYSDDFLSAVEAYLTEIDNKLCAGPSEKDAEDLLNQKAFLREFVSVSKRLLRGEVDPASLPQAIQANGQPIPNYFVLRVGPWWGFFRLDHIKKVGVGALALHGDHDLQDRLAKFLADAAKNPR